MPSSRLPGRRLLPACRAVAALGLLALLAACAGGPHIEARQEAAQYAAKAARNYTPPGPPGDPWGPYIVEAAARYDVPERWIREVMRVESGGKEFVNGDLTTSPVGAMGLMQVMPATYDGLRARYGLGDDPYDPHNNVLAGAAYLREMYDLYGSPGFLAAYNGGPARLDDYLANRRPLPDETRRYVALIGPYIQDSAPVNQSPAAQLAMNQLPLEIAPGLRYGRSYGGNFRVATAGYRPGPFVPPSVLTRHDETRWERSAAALPVPPPPPSGRGRFEPRVMQAMAIRPKAGFHLVSQAMAETVPLRRGGPSNGNWAVQVGAFGREREAHEAAAQAHAAAGGHEAVGSIHQAHATLYRARLTGMSRTAAEQACERIAHGHGHCMVLSPDAQS